MEPDFKALAEAWIANDARMRGLDEDRQLALVSRLAEALERRRKNFSEKDLDLGLVVNIDRDHIGPEGRLSNFAKEKLIGFMEERIDEEIQRPER